MELRGDNCWYCGRTMTLGRVEPGADHGRRACADHFVATSRGGADDQDNLVPACGRCNSIKGNRSIEEARQALILARIGWPPFTAAEIDWLTAQGFDTTPVTAGLLYFEQIGRAL